MRGVHVSPIRKCPGHVWVFSMEMPKSTWVLSRRRRDEREGIGIADSFSARFTIRVASQCFARYALEADSLNLRLSSALRNELCIPPKRSLLWGCLFSDLFPISLNRDW